MLDRTVGRSWSSVDSCAALPMRRAVASISEPSVALSAREGPFPGMSSHVAFKHVLVGKVTAAVGALVNVVAAMKVHMHPDVVSARVHFVAHKADISVTRVRQSVNHKLLVHLLSCWLSGKIECRQLLLLLLLLL